MNTSEIRQKEANTKKELALNLVEIYVQRGYGKVPVGLKTLFLTLLKLQLSAYVEKYTLGTLFKLLIIVRRIIY